MRLRSLQFIFFLILLSAYKSFSQESESVILTGKVYDEQYPDLYLENIMIINLRTQQGVFAEGNNTFSTKILKNDTIVISATGYAIKKICFKDSTITGNTFNTNIAVTRLNYQLKEVTIFEQREWKAIEKDLQTLGYKESDYKLEGVDAWKSPVTALYQAFSRRERSIRKVAQLRNDDMRKSLLTELIHIYIKNKIIALDENQIESFITYLNIDDDYLKSMTQYDLATYIKSRAQMFSGRR